MTPETSTVQQPSALQQPTTVQPSSITQAVGSAAVSLVVFVASVAAFVPPFVERTVSSVPLTIALGIAIAVSFVLHVAFVGIAAHRAGRSATLWAVLAVLLFPVGSIAGLILFEWFSAQRTTAAQGASPQPTTSR
jgi:hypothetical protein